MDKQSQHYTVRDGMTPFGRFSKRTFDILVSASCLTFFSPLILWCWWRVRHEGSGEAAIYSQERIGRYGRPFMIYKFRSMTPNAEASGVPQLFNQDDDPRLTKVGRFLRQHHLDELPQFWNVLIGDMSFIGPRPERKYFIDQIMAHDSRYECLYQIRPGITSYATLYNGYTDTMEKMLRRLNLDLYYLEHRSFWFDVKILWLTFYRIVKGDKF
ncbi:MAG: sugar transferase [Bacteroidales bacterium]|nr:sugar transferase [Candidatus Liminaster caballi]